jgi:gas vesicle protein
MRKFTSLIIGLFIGGGVGALLIILFSPVSADEFRANLKAHYERALQAGREASAKRRAELEAELQAMSQQKQEPEDTQ